MILMYHNIAETAGFNTVSVSELKKQLEYLKNNFEPVSAGDYISDIGISRKKVLVTVDDAYLSFKEFFYPLLRDFNIPALLFLPVDHIGKFNVWDSQMRINIMDWEDIIRISRDDLVAIGSHGRSHQRLSHLTEPEILSEIIESKKEIEARILKPVKYFSYPFGQISDYTEFAVESLKSSGYESGFSTRYGMINNKKDIFELKRIEIEPCDNMNSFRSKCVNNFHIKFFKRIVKESLIKTGLLK